jgi:hypothetical protein
MAWSKYYKSLYYLSPYIIRAADNSTLCNSRMLLQNALYLKRPYSVTRCLNNIISSSEKI